MTIRTKNTWFPTTLFEIGFWHLPTTSVFDDGCWNGKAVECVLAQAANFLVSSAATDFRVCKNYHQTVNPTTNLSQSPQAESLSLTIWFFCLFFKKMNYFPIFTMDRPESMDSRLNDWIWMEEYKTDFLLDARLKSIGLPRPLWLSLWGRRYCCCCCCLDHCRV